MWSFARFWVLLHEVSAAGCGPVEDRGNGDCDYALAYAAVVEIWIALPVIAALTFIALVVCGIRGWRKWPFALAGIGLILAVVHFVIQVIYRAFLCRDRPQLLGAGAEAPSDDLAPPWAKPSAEASRERSRQATDSRGLTVLHATGPACERGRASSSAAARSAHYRTRFSLPAVR
jgi:hypothetical protein